MKNINTTTTITCDECGGNITKPYEPTSTKLVTNNDKDYRIIKTVIVEPIARSGDLNYDLCTVCRKKITDKGGI